MLICLGTRGRVIPQAAGVKADAHCRMAPGQHLPEPHEAEEPQWPVCSPLNAPPPLSIPGSAALSLNLLQFVNNLLSTPRLRRAK